MAKRRMVESVPYGFKSGIVDVDEEYCGKYPGVDHFEFTSQLRNVGFRVCSEPPFLWEFGEEKSDAPVEKVVNLKDAAEVVWSAHQNSEDDWTIDTAKAVLDFAGVKYE